MSKKYELSAAADRDLDDIFDYTTEKFGFDQAVKYLTDFEILFSQLAANPHLGKTRDEIKTGLMTSQRPPMLSSIASFVAGYVSCVSCMVAEICRGCFNV